MQNYVQKGDVVTLTAPYAVASGAGLKVGGIVGIATAAALISASVEVMLAGVFDVTRETGGSTAWAVGDAIYWDDANKRFTKTTSGNTKAGVALAAAADGDATGRIRLNGAF